MPTAPDQARRTTDRIRRLLAEAPVIDGHNDLLWESRVLAGYDFDALGLDRGCPRLQTDLPRLRAGGVGAQFWSLWVPPTLPGPEAVAMTFQQCDAADRLVRRYPDTLAPARSAAGVRAAWADGRIACLTGAEGGHSIDGSLDTLRGLHERGVAYLTLTHEDTTGWADSATDEPRNGGLAPLGRDVVAELNRLGMVVDLSHVSDATMRDALAVTTAPVMFSHSSARSVCDHPRNVPEDVLATMAAGGGVCLVTFVPRFVSQAVRDWDRGYRDDAAAAGIARHDEAAMQSLLEAYEASNPRPHATVDDVVADVEAVRDIAGIEHVGLGGDYDGTAHQPDGLEDVSGYPVLLERLAERGWSDEDLARLTCGNVLRLLDDVETAATSTG